jgi:hypothetical protein
MKIHNKSSIGIISGLYATSNGDGGIIPIQIFICSKCGEPLEQTVPIELKKKKKLDE